MLKNALFTVPLAAAALAFSPPLPQQAEPDAAGPQSSADQLYVMTLYAADPVLSSVSLVQGRPGGVIQDHSAKTYRNDLVYGSYVRDGFGVAKQPPSEEPRRGAIVDLGTPAALQSKYGYRDTVGHHQGFASLRLEEGVIGIGGSILEEGKVLFERETYADESGRDEISIEQGHIYLVRILEGSREVLLAKVLVLEHEPGVLATIRWQIID